METEGAIRSEVKVMSRPYMPCGRARVLVVGLGWIGLEAARTVMGRPWAEVVGAVDPRPERLGKDLGELLGVGPLGIKVAETVEEALEGAEANVAIHATVSRLKDAHPQIIELCAHGLNVVTSAEELIYPELSDLRLSVELDQVARRYKVSVVASGVNPGFVMDRLPAFLARACRSVRAARVRRVVDLTRRREALRRKAGLGMEPERFVWLIREGVAGHVGLSHSAAYLCSALGVEVDRIVEEVFPLIAREPIEAGEVRVPAGSVKGVRHLCRALRGEEEVVRLELVMEVGACPVDEVEVDGDPPVRAVFPGGVEGDEATAALLVNAIPQALSGRPGLCVLDGPPFLVPLGVATRVEPR